MNIRHIFVTLAAVSFCLGLQGLQAADPASPVTASAAPDPEEQLDEGLQRFGYLAGLARGCVVEAQRPALESEAVDLHGAIGRLLGTDRAFMFGAAFGHGTSLTLEVAECKEGLAQYERRVQAFRASSGRVAP